MYVSKAKDLDVHIFTLFTFSVYKRNVPLNRNSLFNLAIATALKQKFMKLGPCM